MLVGECNKLIGFFMLNILWLAIINKRFFYSKLCRKKFLRYVVKEIDLSVFTPKTLLYTKNPTVQL